MDHRIDMTDPFAQVKQRVAKAEALMQQMPPAQRRVLVEAMQTSFATPPQPSAEGRVAMTSVPVSEWDGGRGAMPRSGTRSRIRRPRQRVVPMPPLWHWLVQAGRLQRRLHRLWQRQSRLLKRDIRFLARQARPHHNSRRGRG
jgi:hypothetical protein